MVGIIVVIGAGVNEIGFRARMTHGAHVDPTKYLYHNIDAALFKQARLIDVMNLEMKKCTVRIMGDLTRSIDIGRTVS